MTDPPTDHPQVGRSPPKGQRMGVYAAAVFSIPDDDDVDRGSSNIHAQ